VSLLTRKNPDDSAGVGDRVIRTAQRAVPAAKDAIPRAKQAVPTATTAVRQSAEDVAAWARPRVDEVTAWAKPHVDDARSWAAPRLERSGHMVTDTIAPAVSEAMISAARKLDVQPERRRRSVARVMAVVAMVAAAASAAAAVVLRRRPAEFGDAQGEMSAPAAPQPDATVTQSLAEANGNEPEPTTDPRSANS
jgi:hypothetical protein